MQIERINLSHIIRFLLARWEESPVLLECSALSILYCVRFMPPCCLFLTSCGKVFFVPLLYCWGLLYSSTHGVSRRKVSVGYYLACSRVFLGEGRTGARIRSHLGRKAARDVAFEHFRRLQSGCRSRSRRTSHLRLIC